MPINLLQRTINLNPLNVTIKGNLTVEGTTILDNTFASGILATNNLVQSIVCRKIVPVNTNYVTTETDRFISIGTTMGGPYTVTLTNFDILTSFVMRQVTILMTAHGLGADYTVTCAQGLVTFSAAGHVATFMSYGNGTTWSLIGQPYGATVT